MFLSQNVNLISHNAQSTCLSTDIRKQEKIVTVIIFKPDEIQITSSLILHLTKHKIVKTSGLNELRSATIENEVALFYT
jgi:hypothetical protein